MGIGTISEAKALLLIAAGREKAAPVARAVEGPITAMAPASAVQLHPDATVVVDEAVAAELELVDYYREIARRKGDLRRRGSPGAGA